MDIIKIQVQRLKRRFYNKQYIYTIAIFVAVFFIACFLRFFRFTDIADFGHDNSRDIIRVYKFVKYGEIIYRGPVFSELWGFLNPVYYYILLPVFYFSNFHPLAGPIFTTILNIFALFILFFWGNRLYGIKAATISTLIFGMSFKVIDEASYGVNPSFLPIFSFMMIFSLAEIVLKKNGKMLIPLSISMSAMGSFHPSGFFTFLPTILILLMTLKKTKFTRKVIITSFFIFIFSTVMPYLIQEKKFAWQTFRNLYLYLVDGSGNSKSVVVNIYDYFHVVSNVTSELFLVQISITGKLIFSITVLSAIYFIYRNYKRKQILTFIMFFLFLYMVLFPILIKFERSSSKEAWMHAVFIPIFVVLISNVLSTFFSIKRYNAFFLFSMFLVFATINVTHLINFKPDYDYYSRVVIDSKLIENDSEGKIFEIRRINAQAHYYVLWYFAKHNNPLKNMYYEKIKWNKAQNAKVVYLFLSDKDIVDNMKKKEIIDSYKDEYNLTNEKIFLIRSDRTIIKLY